MPATHQTSSFMQQLQTHTNSVIHPAETRAHLKKAAAACQENVCMAGSHLVCVCLLRGLGVAAGGPLSNLSSQCHCRCRSALSLGVQLLLACAHARGLLPLLVGAHRGGLNLRINNGSRVLSVGSEHGMATQTARVCWCGTYKQVSAHKATCMQPGKPKPQASHLANLIPMCLLPTIQASRASLQHQSPNHHPLWATQASTASPQNQTGTSTPHTTNLAR